MSLSVVIFLRQTNLPVFVLNLPALTPLPPRFVVLISATLILLPIPNSDTTITVSSSSTIVISTTFASLMSFIPRTPFAVLPIDLTCDSLKWIHLPLSLAKIIFFVPSVKATPINSSPSSKLIANLPLRLILSNSVIGVFLIKPFFVAINK